MVSMHEAMGSKGTKIAKGKNPTRSGKDLAYSCFQKVTGIIIANESLCL